MSLFGSTPKPEPPEPQWTPEEHLAQIHRRVDEIADTAKKGARDLSLLAGVGCFFAALAAFGFLATYCGLALL